MEDLGSVFCDDLASFIYASFNAGENIDGMGDGELIDTGSCVFHTLEIRGIPFAWFHSGDSE